MTGEKLVDLRIRVEPGGGVVAVLGGVLLVIPSVRAGQDDAVDALLSAAVTSGVVRAVARVVADFEEERIPPFCVVVAGEAGGMFALVHGEVVLQATGSDQELRLVGREARSWVDRSLPEPLQRLSVLPQDGAAGPADKYSDLRAGVVRGGGVLVTRREPGLQPPSGPLRQSDLAPAPEAGPPPLPPSGPASAGGVASASEGEQPSVTFGKDARAEPEDRRAPADGVAAPASTVTAAPPEPVRDAGPSDDLLEEGVLEEGVVEQSVAEPGVVKEGVGEGVEPAAAGSLADSAAAPVVDAPSDEQPAGAATNGSAYPGRHTGPEPGPQQPRSAEPPPQVPTQVLGPPPSTYGGLRPAPVPSAFDPFSHARSGPLEHTLLQAAQEEPGPGRLVLQDGADVLVDRDCVIGRNPEADPDVARGRAKAVVLPDAEQRISRVHARLILSHGVALIVDQGSVNGTWIEPPGAEGWIAVDSQVPAPLPIGTRIQVGDAVLSYAACANV